MYKLPPGARTVLDAVDLKKYRLQDCPPRLALDLFQKIGKAIHEGDVVDLITLYASYGDELCLVVASESANDDRMIGGWYVERQRAVNPEAFMTTRTMKSAINVALKDRKERLRHKHAWPLLWVVLIGVLIYCCSAALYFDPRLDTKWEAIALLAVMLIPSGMALYWIPRAISKRKFERAWAADTEARAMEALLKSM